MPVPYTDVPKKEHQELCSDTDGGKTYQKQEKKAKFLQTHTIWMDKTDSMKSTWKQQHCDVCVCVCVCGGGG